MAVFNQREATGRQIDAAAIDTRHVVALLDWPKCQPGLTCDLRRCIRQLAPRQRVEKVSSEDRLALSPARQTAIHVRRDKAARFQRVQAPPGDRSSRKRPEQAWR